MESIQFDAFISWVFYGILSAAAVYGVKILAKMNTSIELLNIQVEKLLLHHEYQTKANDNFDSRLKKLEQEYN